MKIAQKGIETKVTFLKYILIDAVYAESNKGTWKTEPKCETIM